MQVTAHGVELPDERFARLLVVRQDEQTVHQSSHDVGAQGKPGRAIAVALALTPGILQECRVREDIRRRPELAEELLGREQTVNPSR